MPRYFDALTSIGASLRAGLAYGLRAKLREGYTRADFRADAMAGLVVGVVALPLSMALAIASGVRPENGLYTAIVAGVACALLGGTRCQVTGPTAAFVVILLPIVTRFGVAGLLVAGLLAGAILIAMAAMRLGKLIQFIPHPVTTGFSAGIGTVIGVQQLQDFFGLQFAHRPESFVERLRMMWESRGSLNGWEVLIGGFSLAALILIPRITKRVPAPLIAMVLAALLVVALRQLAPGFHVETLGSKFHPVIDGVRYDGIPPLPPMPVWPWQYAGGLTIDWATFRELLPSAFAIAMLGAIESLLAAVVSDGLTGTKHDPNSELFAVGVGNILCPFFGGVAATGALARTATNIRAGARSPISTVIHALFVLACTLALAPLVAYMPMAAMAALLMMVAKNMAELRHFQHIVRVAPRSDVTVLLVCFGLTVLFDMVIAVAVGVVLAALLFMRRMSEITELTLDTATVRRLELPEGVRLYEIAGPLFFGAAQRAMDTLALTDGGRNRRLSVILNLEKVPVMDATGLVALETALDRLKRAGHKVILSGARPTVAALLERAGIKREPGKLALAPDVEAALSMAIVHQAREETAAASL